MSSAVGAASGSRPVHRRQLSVVEQWGIVTLHQLRNYIRTNRFYGLLAFVVLVGISTLALEASAGVTAIQVQQLYRPAEYLSNYLSYTGLFVILAAAFFGGDALSVDFSTGAGYYMLVLPIRRPVLLAGRYVAAALVTVTVVGVYFLLGSAGEVYFFQGQSIPWGLSLEAFGVAALFALAAVSVAFCVSSFVRTPSAGVLITVLALYVGFTTLQTLIELAGIEPWFSLPYAGGAIAAVLDTDFIHQQAVPLGAQQYYTVWVATVSEGLSIMLAYIAVFLPLSAFLYHRKESDG